MCTKRSTAALGLIALGLGLIWGPSAPGQQTEAPTLANLRAAYTGESTASAKYAAFAERADEEGHAAAAALFRAASRAEAIHAQNHAQVIESLGGSATADIASFEVGTTADNLRAAIEGESYERDTMYPEFIAAAREERNAEAVRSFNFALTAEAEHARLYQQALDAIESGSDASPVPWYVCTVCGWTTSTLPDQTCPSCFSPREVYEEII